jgi:hypothetical protein
VRLKSEARDARPTHARLDLFANSGCNLNEAELRAYGLVAQALAQHAFAWATHDEMHFVGQFPGVPRPIYDHVSMSTLEAVAYGLGRLKILKQLDQEHDYFVFDCEVPTSNIVAQHNWSDGPTFPELLLTFINLFGDFGTEHWGFSTKQNTPFGTNSRIKRTLEALVPLGYLAKTDAGFIWTDLIAPIMRVSYNFEDWSDPDAS